jgi:hypothetical protein
MLQILEGQPDGRTVVCRGSRERYTMVLLIVLMNVCLVPKIGHTIVACKVRCRLNDYCLGLPQKETKGGQFNRLCAKSCLSFSKTWLV